MPVENKRPNTGLIGLDIDCHFIYTVEYRVSPISGAGETDFNLNRSINSEGRSVLAQSLLTERTQADFPHGQLPCIQLGKGT